MAIRELQQENKNLKEKVEVQENRIVQLERMIRTKNIIIKGMYDEEQENEKELNRKIEIEMKTIGF